MNMGACLEDEDNGMRELQAWQWGNPKQVKAEQSE